MIETICEERCSTSEVLSLNQDADIFAILTELLSILGRKLSCRSITLYIHEVVCCTRMRLNRIAKIGSMPIVKVGVHLTTVTTVAQD